MTSYKDTVSGASGSNAVPFSSPEAASGDHRGSSISPQRSNRSVRRSGVTRGVSDDGGEDGRYAGGWSVSSQTTRSAVVGKPSSLDGALLHRAREIIENLDLDDAYELTLQLAAFGGIVSDLWESAGRSTNHHQSILAILESALLSSDGLSECQASAFREAIIDLGSDYLSESNVEIIQSRFLEQNFSPLALLSELDANDADSKTE